MLNDDLMFVRISLVLALLCGSADAGVDVHVSAGAGAAVKPLHQRTLRAELARQLERVPGGYTLDVSIVQLVVADVSAGIEVRAELRALVSDAHGVAMWTSSARAVAIGAPQERALLERDALSAAAQRLASTLQAPRAARTLPPPANDRRRSRGRPARR